MISGQISPDVLGLEERIRLSVLLTMIPTDEIAALLDLTRDETIELFDLEQVESVIADHPAQG